jgi:hypothetical protein
VTQGSSILRACTVRLNSRLQYSTYSSRSGAVLFLKKRIRARQGASAFLTHPPMSWWFALHCESRAPTLPFLGTSDQHAHHHDKSRLPLRRASYRHFPQPSASEQADRRPPTCMPLSHRNPNHDFVGRRCALVDSHHPQPRTRSLR